MDNPPLCSGCQYFDIQSFSRKSFPWRGIRAGQVYEAAQSGCSFCSMLLEYIEIACGKTVEAPNDAGWIHISVKRSGNDPDALNVVQMLVYYSTKNTPASAGQPRMPIATFHVAAEEGMRYQTLSQYI